MLPRYIFHPTHPTPILNFQTAASSPTVHNSDKRSKHNRSECNDCNHPTTRTMTPGRHLGTSTRNLALAFAISSGSPGRGGDDRLHAVPQERARGSVLVRA